MDCSVSTVKVTDETGTSRGVEIVPSGCEPVSEDVCKSGFMAPAENVSFPQNALKQCCKCQKGETCSLCADPSACTDEEKEKFVGIKDCFGMVENEEEEEETEQKLRLGQLWRPRPRPRWKPKVRGCSCITR